MEAPEPRIVCIIGMHRSGTSMVARLLHQCGLDLGPADRLLKADAANPLGHFEHRGFLDIDRKLLKYFGATWYQPPELRPGWQLDSKVERLRAEARSLAATFAGRSSWGWKEPRASLFLPFWKDVIPNMRFVICIRNPCDVAHSLEKRNGISVNQGAALWYRYVRTSLEDTEGKPRIFSFFEDFFQEDSVEINRLLKFCELPRPDNDSELQGVISTELRHHHSGIQDLLEAPYATSECKHFYLGLRAILPPRLSDFEDRADSCDSAEASVSAFVKTFRESRDSTVASNSAAYPPADRSRARNFKAISKLMKLFGSPKRS